MDTRKRTALGTVATLLVAGAVAFATTQIPATQEAYTLTWDPDTAIRRSYESEEAAPDWTMYIDVALYDAEWVYNREIGKHTIYLPLIRSGGR